MGAGPEQIETSYDVGNSFFATWLDAKMIYTCAAFDGDPSRSLEEAQEVKLDRLCRLAGVRPGARVLDIGCGWGAALEHAVRVRGAAAAHGITLSPAQHAHVVARGVPGVTAQVVDVADYRPDAPFDAVLSVGMLEHVVSPEQAAAGRTRDTLRAYFAKLGALLVPGGRCGLQTITRERMPRDPRLLRELAWATNTIFPGSLAPRLEDVITSVTPTFELMSVETAREDYRITCEHWLARLRAAEPRVRSTHGDARFEEYDRYLRACILGFDQGYLSLCRFSLRKTHEDRNER